MAEKSRYPQIPATVWWGVRSVINKSPKVKVDAKLLGAELGVQDTAAKQYVKELRAVGILDEDGKATDLALRWRLDDSYTEAAKEIVEKAYPEQLLHLSPIEEPSRERAVNWFKREGFGHGAALNKAATYLLLASAEPENTIRAPKAAPARTATNQSATAKPAKVESGKPKPETKPQQPIQRGRSGSSGMGAEGVPPLNINVQIHISADASSDQIESIFSAMRRYLYESESH